MATLSIVFWKKYLKSLYRKLSRGSEEWRWIWTIRSSVDTTLKVWYRYRVLPRYFDIDTVWRTSVQACLCDLRVTNLCVTPVRPLSRPVRQPAAPAARDHHHAEVEARRPAPCTPRAPRAPAPRHPPARLHRATPLRDQRGRREPRPEAGALRRGEDGRWYDRTSLNCLTRVSCCCC